MSFHCTLSACVIAKYGHLCVYTGAASCLLEKVMFNFLQYLREFPQNLK